MVARQEACGLHPDVAATGEPTTTSQNDALTERPARPEGAPGNQPVEPTTSMHRPTRETCGDSVVLVLAPVPGSDAFANSDADAITAALTSGSPMLLRGRLQGVLSCQRAIATPVERSYPDGCGEGEVIARVVGLGRGRDPRRCSGDDYLLTLGPLRLDLLERVFSVGNEVRDLTPMQFHILSYMIANVGRMIGKGEFFQRVFRTHATDHTSALRNQVRALRKSLHPYGDIIRNVRGSGYGVFPDAYCLKGAVGCCTFDQTGGCRDYGPPRPTDPSR